MWSFYHASWTARGFFLSTKREQAMAAVIELLLQSGFVPDGETRTELVRIPTKRSPAFGGSGGELAKLGGRQRFAKEGTNIKATIGMRTTCIYRVEGEGLSGVRGMGTVDTSDLQSIRSVLKRTLNPLGR